VEKYLKYAILKKYYKIIKKYMQLKIKELLKEAMKAGDETAKMTYRSLLSAFTNELVAKGKTPQDAIADDDAMAVIRRAIKQRDDAIKQFTDAGRAELAVDEISEREILMKFLPTQLTEAELMQKVQEILDTQKPLDPKNMGKYIGLCSKSLRDVANGEAIKIAVEKIVSII
jgi:uncharacterized protein